MPVNSWIRSLLIVLFALATQGACAATAAVSADGSQHPAVYAITNVSVLPMTVGGAALEKATVLVENGTITSLNGPVPKEAVIIDGADKWLIPGLVDMHVHTPADGHFNTHYPTRSASIFSRTQDVMTPYVANGVTTIFELNATGGHFGQRNEITRGDVIGPRMAFAAFINGGNGTGRMANTPADGRQTVRMAKAEGYEFVKVYTHLNTETFTAIVDESAKVGMKVIGHIPAAFRGKVQEAFVPHFSLVAHAEEFAKQTVDFSDDDARRFARIAKENNSWLSPTLVVMISTVDQARSLDGLRNLPSLQYVHPLVQSKWLTANRHNVGTTRLRVQHLEKIVDFNKRLVKAFKEAGVPIVAGTDAGSSGVVYGFSLHDELELLVGAGLTPEEALHSATRLPAVWLGLDRVVGTIEQGKFADLVLLEANPFENIQNTRKIAGVFAAGRWLDKSSIANLLADLSRRYADSKDKYEWSKRDSY